VSDSPEQRARREIDAKLTAAGWVVQDRDDLDLTAGRGIAVRNFSMKPLEILLFLRNVKSPAYYEQMKGRGVRVFSADKLRAVTPSAKGRDRFIIVDAVGVCEQDKTESAPLDRKPSAPLEQLLNHVTKGGTRSSPNSRWCPTPTRCASVTQPGGMTRNRPVSSSPRSRRN
jgi:type I site-specific restriction endonuclease